MKSHSTLLVLLLICGPAAAQETVGEAGAAAESDRYDYRADHDPNGIGKFYMGREIAHVMGFAGALWLERDSREEEERLTLLIKSLKLKPGDVVADIGAGSGVISMLMAEQVLPSGYVIGVDVQDEMLLRLQDNARTKGIHNVIPIRGTQQSSSLAPSSIDLAIMVDVYHEFEFPYEMMADISKAIRPGGRVVLVEYRMEDPTVPIKLVHKMSEAQAVKEVEQPEFRLKWSETIAALPRQHVIVFTKQPDRSAD
ncbi:MAG: methyltransferase domain-containing protein [Planctomycetaceae bacterium]|nr:methyltransferase domain-containing protein [Planctomycetaceae bacterium]